MIGNIPENDTLTVTELTGRIKRILEKNIGRIWVHGEISNFTHYASGHMYFSLKDASAQIRCVMFSGANRHLHFRPENGAHVRASGTISVYAPQGSYQLIVSEMHPTGMGELHQAFENLKLKLQTEGLFDARWKKPLPKFPKRIGVVTSPDGAAICDIMNVIQRRFPLVELVLCPARVQGLTAASEIIRAIHTFQQLPFGERPDVLIVGRGGGSIEDLWPFNEEPLARAVFQCDIPIISAVGHEIDFTICDFVADLRAPTPSAAAEAAVPDQQEIRQTLKSLSGRLSREILNGIKTRRLELEKKEHHNMFRPEWMIRDLQMSMDRMFDQLTALIKERLYLTSTRLAQMNALLLKMKPDTHLIRLRSEIATLVARLTSAWRADLHQRKSAMNSIQTRISAFNLQPFHRALELSEARLTGHDPRKILQKGYAICTHSDGSIVSSVLETVPKETVGVELKDGSLACEILTIRRNDE
ncbi:exodeoxyribonuclease VII large subunit [bacterium]|nr:exodeoxyribonuclease VII large subunit [candidate division CSSED10-310 bacterium]